MTRNDSTTASVADTSKALMSIPAVRRAAAACKAYNSAVAKAVPEEITLDDAIRLDKLSKVESAAIARAEEITEALGIRYFKLVLPPLPENYVAVHGACWRILKDARCS